MATVNGDIVGKLARAGFTILHKYGVVLIDVMTYVDSCTMEFRLSGDERKQLLDQITMLAYSSNGGSK